jgi:hypothetical protein
MKSRHQRFRVSVLAGVVMVLGVAGWASAQVMGGGTPGTIPLWTSSNTIGDSSITQNGNGDQTINGSLNVTGSLSLPTTTGPNTGVILMGGVPVLYTLSTPSCPLTPPSVCGRNTFVGPSAGNFTTTGFDNTATGDEALDSITTGSQNTATGSYALFSNTSGFANIATGWQALFSNTTGGNNVATGWRALFLNTTGGNNVATGTFALFANRTGNANTAVGDVTLVNNTTGNGNTATGVDALFNNTTGSNNTATGGAALFNNATGRENTAIGTGAGFNITGNNNIDIGFEVQGAPGESNTIRIGNVNNNRTFIAGISGVATGLPGTAVFVDANGQLGTISSSRRFKDEIQDMGDASSDLMKLRPVTFHYKQAQEDGTHPLQYGLVAEEVAEVNPGLVQFDEEGQAQTVLYHVLPAMLLNEVQKEHQKIEDQQKLIQSQQEQLKAQEERLRKLEAILSSKTN